MPNTGVVHHGGGAVKQGNGGEMSEKPDRIVKAEQAVVRAAEAWVNFEDTGSIPALERLSRLQERLVGAVTRLQRARRRAA
jgi:hypothetical protein